MTGILLALMLAFFAGGIRPAGEKEPSAGQASERHVTEMYFAESASYVKAIRSYSFKCEEGKFLAVFELAYPDEPFIIEVDQTWAETLDVILLRYEVTQWDGFSESDRYLLDGTHFSFDCTFSDGTSVTANGYGSFPRGYYEASAEIEKLFESVLPEDMRDW